MNDATQYKSKGGWRRIIAAARYSMSGIRATWRHEAAFRQEVAIAVALMPIAIWTWINRGRWPALLLIGSMLFVLVVELLNSGLEALADAVSLEHRVLLGRAKDMGSAAVFFSLIIAVMIWLCVLWPE